MSSRKFHFYFKCICSECNYKSLNLVIRFTILMHKNGTEHNFNADRIRKNSNKKPHNRKMVETKHFEDKEFKLLPKNSVNSHEN